MSTLRWPTPPARRPRLSTGSSLARTNLHDLPGVSIIYQLDTAMLPTVRTHFGYRDGVSTLDRGQRLAWLTRPGTGHQGRRVHLRLPR